MNIWIVRKTFSALAFAALLSLAVAFQGTSTNAQQMARLKVVDVLGFDWLEGHPEWEQNSRRRLPTLVVMLAPDGRFAFDLPDLVREMYPVTGRLRPAENGTFYVDATKEWRPGTGGSSRFGPTGSITNVTGRMAPHPSGAILFSFQHTSRMYSTGFTSSYAAEVFMAPR